MQYFRPYARDQQLAASQSAIGKTLRASYDPILSEPIPAALAGLLERLNGLPRAESPPLVPNLGEHDPDAD